MIDRPRGAGWFADPRGKPRLFRYGRDLVDFAMGLMFLRSQPATELAYSAAQSVATPASGDGIAVSEHPSCLDEHGALAGEGVGHKRCLAVSSPSVIMIDPPSGSHCSNIPYLRTSPCVCFQSLGGLICCLGGTAAVLTWPYASFRRAHVTLTPQVKMMDDYLEFRPKEGGEDAVVGVSRLDMTSVRRSTSRKETSPLCSTSRSCSRWVALWFSSFTLVFAHTVVFKAPEERQL